MSKMNDEEEKEDLESVCGNGEKRGEALVKILT